MVGKSSPFSLIILLCRLLLVLPAIFSILNKLTPISYLIINMILKTSFISVRKCLINVCTHFISYQTYILHFETWKLKIHKHYTYSKLAIGHWVKLCQIKCLFLVCIYFLPVLSHFLFSSAKNGSILSSFDSSFGHLMTNLPTSYNLPHIY